MNDRHLAAQMLLRMMWLYSGYKVQSRGPIGCIHEVLRLLAPDLQKRLEEGADPEDLLDPEPAEGSAKSQADSPTTSTNPDSSTGPETGQLPAGWRIASEVRPGDATFAIVDENGALVATFQGPRSDANAQMVVDLVQSYTAEAPEEYMRGWDCAIEASANELEWYDREGESTVGAWSHAAAVVRRLLVKKPTVGGPCTSESQLLEALLTAIDANPIVLSRQPEIRVAWLAASQALGRFDNVPGTFGPCSSEASPDPEGFFEMADRFWGSKWVNDGWHAVGPRRSTIEESRADIPPRPGEAPLSTEELRWQESTERASNAQPLEAPPGVACDRCGARDTSLKNKHTFLFCHDRAGCDARKAKRDATAQGAASQDVVEIVKALVEGLSTATEDASYAFNVWAERHLTVARAWLETQTKPAPGTGILEFPFEPNDFDETITCIYCRRDHCGFALTVRRPGERAITGLCVACRSGLVLKQRDVAEKLARYETALRRILDRSDDTIVAAMADDALHQRSLG